jgi:hypothetical protein
MGKNQHPRFFLKMRTFFKNRPPWYHKEIEKKLYHGAHFLKNVLISSSRKKGGAGAFEKDSPFVSKGTVQLRKQCVYTANVSQIKFLKNRKKDARPPAPRILLLYL